MGDDYPHKWKGIRIFKEHSIFAFLDAPTIRLVKPKQKKPTGAKQLSRSLPDQQLI